MSDFKRELRYGVVKLKNLTESQQKQFWDLVDSFDLPQLECVVVESDWPMYEETWESIKQWANGDFVPRKKLKDRIKYLEGYADEVRAELHHAQYTVGDHEELKSTLSLAQIIYGYSLKVEVTPGETVECKNAAVLSFPNSQSLHVFKLGAADA